MFVGKRVKRTLRGGSAVLPKRGGAHVIPKHESFFAHARLGGMVMGKQGFTPSDFVTYGHPPRHYTSLFSSAHSSATLDSEGSDNRAAKADHRANARAAIFALPRRAMPLTFPTWQRHCRRPCIPVNANYRTRTVWQGIFWYG